MVWRALTPVSPPVASACFRVGTVFGVPLGHSARGGSPPCMPAARLGGWLYAERFAFVLGDYEIEPPVLGVGP